MDGRDEELERLRQENEKLKKKNKENLRIINNLLNKLYEALDEDQGDYIEAAYDSGALSYSECAEFLRNCDWSEKEIKELFDFDKEEN